MAFEMLRFSEMNDQIAIQEAASDGLKGMDHLIRLLSQHQNDSSPNYSSSSNNQLDCSELTEYTVAKFRKVVSVLNRTGHARFRRGPVQSSIPANDVSPSNIPAPIANFAAKSMPKTMTIDFSKPNLVNSSANGKIVETTSECFSLSTTGSSSFVSTITGEGSVSNGKLGLSMFSAPEIGGEGSVSNGKLGLTMFSAPAIGGEGSVSNGKLGLSMFSAPEIGGEGSVSNGKLGLSMFSAPAIVGEGSVSNGKLGLSIFSAQNTAIGVEGSVSNGKLGPFLAPTKTIGGDKRVSNEKFGSSMFITLAPAIYAGEPPLSTSHKKRCHEHVFSDNISVSEKCHCAKRRKTKVKKTIKVPAISSKIADIPADEYSWRKYGQKPIKGSPYPRGYYRCSTVKRCPAVKHVERDPEEPTMLIVTYKGEHRHSQSALQGNIVGGAGVVVFESTREH